MRFVPRLVLALTTAAVCTLTGTTAAQAGTGSYVALGDSYSSGVGSTSNYLDSCDRSTAAYPYRYDRSAAPSAFSFQACTGATASSIESRQLGALSSSTTLVSLTDGGNDIGFSTVMEDCVLYSQSTCLAAVADAEAKMSGTLPGTLHTLYSDIRAHAPAAHVVVIGYPEFYDLSKSSGCIGLTTKDRTAIDGAADQLDSVIKTQVAKYSGFTFADVRGYFSGHELCDSSEWLHSLAWPISSSYHPTATGQADAYLPAFEAAL